MSDVIERPLFTEGETLRAEDLNAAGDQARARDARHARQAHRWGIVVGLQLEGSAGLGGFEVRLKPGVARDVRGREIVVPKEEVLSPNAFNVGGKEDDWFPVFLVGIDEVVSSNVVFGSCGSVAGRRAREAYEIEYGRPQEAIDWEIQDQPDVGDGPELPATGTASRVLLGFVQWKNNNFAAAKDSSPGNVRPRHAGLRGGSIESPDGSVLGLLGDTEKEALSFHVGGSNTPIFSLDRQGNLSIQGTLNSALKGDIKVSSGVASDGVKLPLPAGVNESDVGSKLSLHIFVRPAVASGRMLVTAECAVDDQRRVRCRVLELDATATGAGTAAKWLDGPKSWPADYLLVAGPKGTP